MKKAKYKTWRSKLTKSELTHLKLMNYTTIVMLKELFKIQAEWRKEDPPVEPCFTCKGIAIKLGMDV